MRLRVALAFLIGCSVGELDPTGKQCPCVDGFTCDETTNRCVTGPIAVQDAAPQPPPTDAGPPDAAPAGFAIQRFGATWRTSKSVRWEWVITGDASTFAEYQIVVGGSEDAVRRRDSSTLTFDRRINPELGHYDGRSTVTDRHLVAKKAFAQLIVRDKVGRENASAIASIDTLPENSVRVLFADQLVQGTATLPAELKPTANSCFAGAGCLLLSNLACPDAQSCEFDIGLRGLDVVATMQAGDFEDAFVELAVRGGTSASPNPHSDLVIAIGPSNCAIAGRPCRFRAYGGWSFRPGVREYRLIQLPLRTLQLETPTGPGAALTHANLAANDFRIRALAIRGAWKEGAAIGIDHAHIRW